MTREEAIKILKGAIKKPNTEDGYIGQALSMAISALEQEPKKLTCTLEDFKRFATENNYAILTTELYSKAITALEQEPCEDAISREAVINAINSNAIRENEYNLTASRIKELVKELPSVTQYGRRKRKMRSKGEAE